MSDRLADYRAALLAGGCAPAEADQAVADLAAEFAALDRCQCPKCGAALTKTRDGHQQGPSAVKGEWFSYRCACGFMMDRVENVE